MVWYHRYSEAELCQVTGLSAAKLQAKLKQFKISSDTRPKRRSDKVHVLPYPGGRHPRIGFLDGAVDPQRETKLSVFCPWDDHSYAVLDVPEAIWSNLGLTYLAHTHVDTVWTQQNVQLKQQEWDALPDGSFVLVRRLPNGIEFGTKAIPMRDHVRMKMWLSNGTDNMLSGLRVQNCVMLKGAEGFRQQDNDNKQFTDGYAIAHSPDQKRWMISGWDPVHRAWGNTKCPCLHSDPKFEDCPPGETKWLRGWFSFYEGDDVTAELKRIEATGWRTHPLHHVTGNLVGKVVDSETKKTLPCRLYVQNVEDQRWHFATSTAVAGTSVKYDKQLGRTSSIERHTTLSADGFQLELPPGRYRVRAEYGKEYVPAETEVTVGKERVRFTLKLKRFADMASRGWYSGDTHVHRTMEELPNVILAEDLNVALPLNYWVRDNGELPSDSGPALAAKPQHVDATHVIYPVNTEYEIFTINRKRHTQGAVFVLNHKTPLELPAPPIKRIAVEARKQNAILDLDKHSWNWSLMVVPIMNVDLFELSNNHHWRADFGFPKWTIDTAPPDWPGIELDDNGFTEKGWTEFGFQTYYALLNCGFRMRVSAGTASGVHPVPLGHGRVYVHTGDDFTYDQWIANLDAGHSFVTQGPLMDLRFNDCLAGTTWQKQESRNRVNITGEILSSRLLQQVEIIVNGDVAKTIELQAERTDAGAYQVSLDASVGLEGSGWVAVRCYEESPKSKGSFAHTNPVFIDVVGQPLKPRRREVEYFVQRMEREIKRNTDVLSDDAVAEFREAKKIYEGLLKTAE